MSAAPVEVLDPLAVMEAAPHRRAVAYAQRLAAMAVNSLLEAGLEVVDKMSRFVPSNQENIRRRPDQDPIDW